MPRKVSMKKKKKYSQTLFRQVKGDYLLFIDLTQGMSKYCTIGERKIIS